MIEVDAIAELVKHRASVFGSIELWGRAYNTKSLFDKTSAAITNLVQAPAFILEVKEEEMFGHQMVLDDQFHFALPFPAFSVVVGIAGEANSIVSIRLIDQQNCEFITFLQTSRGKKQWSLGAVCNLVADAKGLYLGVPDVKDKQQLINENLNGIGLPDNTLNVMATLLVLVTTGKSMTFKPATPSLTPAKVSASKKPLWEYRVVELDSVRAIPAPPKGGHHATPRWHQVRGFWRQIKKSGKRVFVQSHARGDKSKGIIEHDYVVTA
jgi:hypothetical protein